jgi:hypothetical protein
MVTYFLPYYVTKFQFLQAIETAVSEPPVSVSRT